MASIISIKECSPFIDSPIIFQVKAAVLTGEISFHKVKLEVTAGLSSTVGEVDETQSVFTFSTPVGSGEMVQMDISSALRAVADGYTYTSNPPSAYPCVVFSLRAWDEYMQNGQETKKTGIISFPDQAAILGKVSDYTRMFSVGGLLAQKFSLKPVDGMPEIVCNGDTLVIPKDWDKGHSIGGITTGPTSEVVTVELTADEEKNGCMKSYYGHPFYVMSAEQVKKAKNRFLFRFINSLGVMESYSVLSNSTQTMKMSSSKFETATQETFSQFSRVFYDKKNDIEVLKLSTGPLSVEWVNWVLHEFLMTQTAWILLNNHWIPCNIVADDSVTGLDRSKSDNISIDFSVELNMAGSWNL